MSDGKAISLDELTLYLWADDIRLIERYESQIAHLVGIDNQEQPCVSQPQ